MDKLIKRTLRQTNPELESGNHLPRWGIITRIPATIKSGQVSTPVEPAYAVDVQLLTQDGQPDGNPYESVPLPVTGVGHNRGFFAFPPVGTRVLVQFAYGSPAHPVITGIYPTDRHLPALKEAEVLIQQSAATYQRATESEDWDIRARNKVRVGNKDVDLVAEVQRLASLLADHKHPKTDIPTNAEAIAGVANKVEQIKL